MRWSDFDAWKESTAFVFVLPVSYVKVKVKFNLEQATKTHRGSRGIAVLFL